MNIELSSLYEQWFMLNIGYGVVSAISLRYLTYLHPHALCGFHSVISIHNNKALRYFSHSILFVAKKNKIIQLIIIFEIIVV